MPRAHQQTRGCPAPVRTRPHAQPPPPRVATARPHQPYDALHAVPARAHAGPAHARTRTPLPFRMAPSLCPGHAPTRAHPHHPTPSRASSMPVEHVTALACDPTSPEHHLTIPRALLHAFAPRAPPLPGAASCRASVPVEHVTALARDPTPPEHHLTIPRALCAPHAFAPHAPSFLVLRRARHAPTRTHPHHTTPHLPRASSVPVEHVTVLARGPHPT